MKMVSSIGRESSSRDLYWDVMKGIAILFVVTIHYLGSRTGDEWTFLIRRFASISVFSFIFMAGYFTDIARVGTDCVAFVKKRCLRLLETYLFWTVVSLLVFSPRAFLEPARLIFHDILLGYGVSIGYYVILLVQLTLLTPVLVRLVALWPVKTLVVSGMMMYFMSTVSALAFAGWITSFGLAVPVPFPAIFFPSLLFPYVLGLVLRQSGETAKVWLKRCRGWLACACVVLFVVALLQRQLLKDFGLPQFNVADHLFTTAWCLAAVAYHREAKGVLLGALATLGRGSFFIYLTHLKLFVAMRKALPAWFGFQGGDVCIMPYLAGMTIMTVVYLAIISASERWMLPRLKKTLGV